MACTNNRDEILSLNIILYYRALIIIGEKIKQNISNTIIKIIYNNMYSVVTRNNA